MFIAISVEVGFDRAGPNKMSCSYYNSEGYQLKDNLFYC